jgi:DNA ligase 1
MEQNSMISRPMLAAKFDSDPAVAYKQMKSLCFPVLASTKIDGIRAHQYQGVLYSRKNKPIPNAHTQKLFSDLALHGADGELVVGRPNTNSCFNTTQSGTMSQDGQPDVKYHIFDYTAATNPSYSFSIRQTLLSFMAEIPNIILVEQKLIHSLDDLLSFEYESVTAGWEGIMIRALNGPYKEGRSTLREGWLIKMKQFRDSEAVILSAYEQETNLNESTINEIGRSKRSSHQENKIANGHLGGFRVRDIKSGVEFNIGNFDGVTKELRHQWWQNYLARPDYFAGRVITYKFFPVGVKDKPRHPTLRGFRSKIDL